MTTFTNQIDLISKRLKIVLIEDNSELAKWLSDKIDGFEKLEIAGNAKTYKGAYEMITNLNPELVILDLKLPDGSGIDILKKIRNAKLNIKVMVLTMNIQASNVCLRMGADYFFDKSKDIDILLEKLKSFDG